jgi:tRNA (guanine37-N1)-methyltransferase|tara:strand:+ start:63 stop:764 length:702 start_codon:yes stop_codon:yes gene_type:complete
VLKVKIFTLYPDLFPGPLDSGIYKTARQRKIWDIDIINIRNYSTDKHKKVDDTPFGGGNGMLIRPDIIAKALDKNINYKLKNRNIYLSPKGKVLNQDFCRTLSKEDNINIICGHFEGVDQRIIETRNIEEISVGDFILSGGETASYVLLDSIIRLLPGVLGNKFSIDDESFEHNLLEYPQFTKPQKWGKKEVPNVLLSGDHAKIKGWRLSQSEAITQRQRPDLWKKYLKKKNK